MVTKSRYNGRNKLFRTYIFNHVYLLTLYFKYSLHNKVMNCDIIYKYSTRYTKSLLKKCI